MEGLNQVTLIGTVGSDPEVKTVGAKQSTLATFRLATNRSYKNNETGERITDTQWHTIESWNKMAESFVAKHVKKGKNLVILGEIRYSTSEDENGTKRYYTSIYAKDINFLPDSGGANNQNAQPQQQQAAPAVDAQQARQNVQQYSQPQNQQPAQAPQEAVPIGPDAFGGSDDGDDLPF